MGLDGPRSESGMGMDETLDYDANQPTRDCTDNLSNMPNTSAWDVRQVICLAYIETNALD